MPTQAEEQQVRDFLKRAEVHTMKKDLQALREVDALKERDKIAKIKTLEEQLQEQQSAQEIERARAEAEKLQREEVLGRNSAQERLAEKDLKNYATEEERQKIFLLESQRLELEKQVDVIDKEKDPQLKLQKNQLLIKLRDQQTKLNAIVADEKKQQDQEKFLIDQEQGSANSAEKKGLEQSRADLEKKVQEMEKKRWAVEKEIENINSQSAQIDKSSDLLVFQKNDLRNKILGTDKQLRETYSAILSREEDRRRGDLQTQKNQREQSAQAKAKSNEDVRRQQWGQVPSMRQSNVAPRKITPNQPLPAPRKIFNTKSEEKQRQKFLKDVEQASQIKGQQQEKSNII